MGLAVPEEGGEAPIVFALLFFFSWGILERDHWGESRRSPEGEALLCHAR